MTTLFKKLSITTLTLAIASGIVFSVGSSEPSTFEGQATSVYTATFSSTDSTLSSGIATANVTQSLYNRKINVLNTASANFPLSYTGTSSGDGTTELVNNIGFEIKNITSISINRTGSFSEPIRVFYSNTTTFGSDQAQFTANDTPVAISGNYFKIVFFNPASFSLNSITITYTC